MSDDLTPPADLLALKLDWLKLHELCGQIANEPPPEGAETIAGIPQPSHDQRARLRDARAARVEITLSIHRHPWMSENGFRQADEALTKAAKKRLADPALALG